MRSLPVELFSDFECNLTWPAHSSGSTLRRFRVPIRSGFRLSSSQIRNNESGIFRCPGSPHLQRVAPLFLSDVRLRCPIAVVVRTGAMPNRGSDAGGFSWSRRVMDFLMTPRYRVCLFTRRPHGAFFYLQALDTQERIIGFAARLFCSAVVGCSAV